MWVRLVRFFEETDVNNRLPPDWDVSYEQRLFMSLPEHIRQLAIENAVEIRVNRKESTIEVSGVSRVATVRRAISQYLADQPFYFVGLELSTGH